MQDASIVAPGANRLHWLTRYSFLPLVLFTAVFGPLLVLKPGSTDDYWSWSINPDLSAVWVGAGYTFGAVAISTMLIRGRWTEAIVPVLGTWPFALVMLLATLVHNDRFFTDTANYYIWLAIYVYLPIGLPVMFLLNRGSDPGASSHDKLLPIWLRAVLCTAGLMTAACGLLLVAGSNAVMDAWPWQLSPLMAKVIGGWLLFIATGAALTAVEERYSAYRFYFPVSSFWFALLLVASIANSEEMDNGLSPILFFGAVTCATVGSLGVFLFMERAPGPEIAADLDSVPAPP